MTLVAALQIEPGPHAWERSAALVALAASRGARVVALPETFLEDAPLEAHAADLAALARDREVALVAGTLREAAPADARPYQTTLVYNAKGDEVFRYRKLHLFDVTVPGGPAEKESASIRPGPVEGARAFELEPIGRCGLGICYDLRFAELWRALVAGGARTLFVPSSFALQTGKDHWHVLLRARAVENLAWIVAPAQVGRKPDGRVRYGHALIVDPWGTVLADAGGDGDGIALAELDFARQEKVRAALPCLEHRRL
jgi:predicted amidohydrolase